MTSETMRDPVGDRLLTPKNAAVLFIDYQPAQVGAVLSMDRRLLAANAVALARIAMLFAVPVVLSTVNVKDGSDPTVPALKAALPGSEEIDRTTINAWEDVDFVRAVKATGRRKLVMAALWTEACLTFPTLDALAEGYDVYPVVDAVGGTSLEAHRAGLERVAQAGARPTSVVQLLCELQRDWNRRETMDGVAEILFAVQGR